jgi:hypothetical protein
MTFDWNESKNQTLKNERAVSFERIVVAVEEGHLLDVLEHPNKDKYYNQLLLVVEIENYVYLVPTVVDKDVFFLKTIFPSRKYTDKYLPGVRRKL